MSLKTDPMELMPATHTVETSLRNIQPNDKSNIQSEADVKHDTQHVETASIEHDKEIIRDVDAQYTDGDDGKPRTGWRKMLRVNPSLDFMREVAEANAVPLDPAEVKRVSFCL